jgi:hypothetical protein
MHLEKAWGTLTAVQQLFRCFMGKPLKPLITRERKKQINFFIQAWFIIFG